MKVSELVMKEVDLMPPVLEEGILYVSKKYKTAIHLCACGCGIKTVTPLNCLTGWTLTESAEGATLQPSIGNMQFPCGSHYWITNGKIEWC